MKQPVQIWAACTIAQYFNDSRDTSTAYLHKQHHFQANLCLVKNHSFRQHSTFKLPPQQQNQTAKSLKRKQHASVGNTYLSSSVVESVHAIYEDSFAFTLEGEGKMQSAAQRSTPSDPSTGGGASGVLAAHLMI